MPILTRRKFTTNVAALYGAPAAGGGSWVPTDLGSALRLWVKADTGVTSSAGAISQVNDQSGNNFHLIGDVAKPTINATGYNGHPAIMFSAASNQFLATQDLPGAAIPVALNLGTSSSWFFAGQMGSSTANFGRIVSYLSATDAAGTATDYQGTTSCLVHSRDATSSTWQGTHASSNLAPGTISTNTNLFALMVFDNTNAKLYINDFVTPLATTAASFSLGGGGGVIMFGGFLQCNTGSIAAPTLACWDGPMAEFLVTNTAMDATTRANLKAYALARIGL